MTDNGPHPSLAFAHISYRGVVGGERQQTIRRRCDPRIAAGCTVRADVLGFAELAVTEVVRKRLGDLSEEDARAEGAYSLAAYAAVWASAYGAWDPDEVVTLIRFRLAPPPDTGPQGA